jgi:hypothetical protein
MRTIFVVTMTVVASSWLGGRVSGQDKKAETIVHKVTAEEIAKEFEKDSKAAEKKYDPKAPKGGASGSVIDIEGRLAAAVQNDIFLKTDSKVTLVLRVKNLKQPPEGNKLIQAKGGKFFVFQNNTIIVQVDEVTVGDGKK